MHSPSEEHMKATIRILQYLKSSPGKGIMFTNGDILSVEGYTAADWAGSIDDRRSTTRYLSFVGGNLVTWQSKNKELWLDLVQKLSTEVWLQECVSYYGLKVCCMSSRFHQHLL